MVVSAFMDRSGPPTRDELRLALESTAGCWDALVDHLTVAMGARDAWQWGGAKYGWEQRFKRAGKPFTTLTPGFGGFTALVILGREESDRAAGLPLGERSRRTFEAAQQYHDGRWLYLRVKSAEDVADVEALLRVKLPPTVRAKMLAAT